MSFKDRARNGLAGLVLLGASAGLGGCGALIIAAGEENAAHVRGHYEVEAAKIRAKGLAESDQRNVVSDIMAQINRSSVPGVYACNRYEDINHNGNIMVPQELFGIKEEFTEGERISIVFYHLLPSSYSYKIINSDGASSSLQDYPRESFTDSMSFLSFSYNDGSNKLCAGDYKAVLTGANNFMLTKDFKVVGANKPIDSQGK